MTQTLTPFSGAHVQANGRAPCGSSSVVDLPNGAVCCSVSRQHAGARPLPPIHAPRTHTHTHTRAARVRAAPRSRACVVRVHAPPPSPHPPPSVHVASQAVGFRLKQSDLTTWHRVRSSSRISPGVHRHSLLGAGTQGPIFTVFEVSIAPLRAWPTEPLCVRVCVCRSPSSAADWATQPSASGTARWSLAPSGPRVLRG